MTRRLQPIAALAIACSLMLGCGGSSRGQPMGGIHARLGYSEGGGLRVLETPEGGAAALSGLQVDDVIIAINGEPVRELGYQEVVERLRGPVGSSVQLDVFRDGTVKTYVVMRQAYLR